MDGGAMLRVRDARRSPKVARLDGKAWQCDVSPAMKYGGRCLKSSDRCGDECEKMVEYVRLLWNEKKKKKIRNPSVV